MERRSFIRTTGLAGVLAAGAAPAIVHAQANIRWRVASSFPRSLDTLDRMRRNPEGRWRLTPQRLNRVVQLQQRLLDLGAQLVKPGGRLVYAVCSLLSREGAGQIDRFLEARSSWISEETPIAGGRLDGVGRLLTPGHDQTDGFFVARLRRPC